MVWPTRQFRVRFFAKVLSNGKDGRLQVSMCYVVISDLLSLSFGKDVGMFSSAQDPWLALLTHVSVIARRSTRMWHPRPYAVCARL